MLAQNAVDDRRRQIRQDTHGEVSGQAPCPAMLDELSPQQTRVLAEISVGKSITAAAASAGVNRMTIYRWQRNDANYRAALNAWRRQTADSVRHRLLAMADRAVAAISNALSDADAQNRPRRPQESEPAGNHQARQHRPGRFEEAGHPPPKKPGRARKGVGKDRAQARGGGIAILVRSARKPKAHRWTGAPCDFRCV